MRGMFIALLAVAVTGAAALVTIFWLRGRLFSPQRVRGMLAETLAAHGPARCVAAAKALNALTRAPQNEIERVWEQLELPLLQALPDCPPDYKIDLIAALDALARATRRVEVAKRIMTMRNSLIA